MLSYGLQTGANLLLGVCSVEAPAPVAYAAAVVAASVITLTRPAHNAILPSLAETPGELTAANAASSTMDGIGTLIGPLAGAIPMGRWGPEAPWDGGRLGALGPRQRSGAAGSIGRAHSSEHVSTFLTQALGGLRQARREPDVATLLGVGGVQFGVMVGMLDVFFALLAIDMLGSGEGGAGVLAGGSASVFLLGAAGAVGLVGVRRLAPAVLVALLGSGAALGALSLASTMPVAVVVLALRGRRSDCSRSRVAHCCSAAPMTWCSPGCSVSRRPCR